ncbi:MAG: T9SS type A sorting domain-containing protein [Bacteroidetes bacterium]|nr:T9SS type A sorting domain-containing protein [Bacteroidota bacterium]
MKNVYKVIFAMCACLLTLMPQSGSAQCLCSGGVPATPVTQSINIPPTVTSSITYNFQQFDPSIGTLSCVRLRDTVTIITVSSALNTGPDSTAFLFGLTVPSKISAPGITISKVFTRTYGYDTLAPHLVPGYTISYGPDTLANNLAQTGSTVGNAAYLGLGTVPVSFQITGGGLQVLDGGLNDTTSVATTMGGTVTLTYYWCPALPLANTFGNFTAAKNGNNIQIQWQGQNEQLGISYEIQYSKDGTHFLSLGNQMSDSSFYGKMASYQFIYPISSADNGKIYFRIKRTSPSGTNIIYSEIKTVNLSNTGISSYRTYPNPVSTYTVLEFDEVLTGDYTIELVNTAGQVVQRNAVSLAGTNQYKLDLNSHPATGLYFLRVTGKKDSHQYLTKLIIE